MTTDTRTINRNPVLAFYKTIWKSIDWIYPPNCAGCGKPGTRWCDECHAASHLLEEPLCIVCGVPVKGDGLCEACRKTERSFRQLRSWGMFDGSLRKAIHQLKYQNDLGLADVFYQFMVEKLIELDWDFDMVVPVPLNKQRKMERGYNQSALLARPIAFAYKKEFSQKALFRVRNTVSQTSLNADERKNNVAGAFEATPKMVADRKILLIDDLATTCSTMDACSSALMAAGANIVYAFTLARTI